MTTSHIEQTCWSDNQGPGNSSTSRRTPACRATRSGGATIVSRSATDAFCYFCSRWAGVEQVDLVTSGNQMATFDVNNGGGLLFADWSFGLSTRSITGPFASQVTGGWRRNTLAAPSNGDIWDVDPLWLSGAPSWTARYIVNF